MVAEGHIEKMVMHLLCEPVQGKPLTLGIEGMKIKDWMNLGIKDMKWVDFGIKDRGGRTDVHALRPKGRWILR